MNPLTSILKPLALSTFLTVAPALSAQMMVLRPEKVPDRPKVAPIELAKAPVKIKEASVKQAKRTAAVNPRRTNPKVKAPSAVAVSLPPLEFVAEEDYEDNTPRLDLSTFTGGRPVSHTDELYQAVVKPMTVGSMTVGVPDCITVFESGPDFLTGSMSNQIDMEVWQFDPTYKLSTPQAYIKYIQRHYGGIEENVTQGNRTDISGFDVKSNRNYRVRMITDGDKLYVGRVIYRPAMEKAVVERILPQLLTSSVQTAEL